MYDGLNANIYVAQNLLLGLHGSHRHGLIETQSDVCRAFKISIWPRATQFGILRTDSILCQVSAGTRLTEF